MIEGSLTQDRIWALYQNAADMRDANLLSDVFDFLSDQISAMRKRASESDPKAHQVALTLAQFDGLVKGYNDKAPEGQALSAKKLWLLQSDGDVIDIEEKLLLERKAR